MSANRRFTSQFNYSQERQPVKLMSIFTQSGSPGAPAALTNQGVTYTARLYGVAGNSISIRLIDPAAINAALVISVAGSAISASLATDGSGVITTTATLLIAALNLDASASALIVASGAGASPLTALALTNLSGGSATVFTQLASFAGMSLVQLSAGTFQILLSNTYAALLAPSIKLQRATAVDLNPQMVSADPLNKSIIFRMLAGATPTDLANGDVLVLGLTLRNSANSTGVPL